MDDDLVCRVHISVFVDVIRDVKDASIVVSQLFGKCLSQGLSVPGCQSLTFNPPDGNWVNTAPVKPESDSKCWDLQVSQLELPLVGFVHSLLHDRDASCSSGLVVYAKVSHDRDDWWLFLCEGLVGMFVCAYEGCLFGAHLHA